MRATETQLAHLERDSLQFHCNMKNLPMKFQRIESHATAQGIADVYCIVDGISFWIENKIWPDTPKPLQWGWMNEIAAAGGLVFICTHGGHNNAKIELVQVQNGRVSAYYIDEDAVGLKLLELIGIK